MRNKIYMTLANLALIVLISSSVIYSQTEAAYHETDEEKKTKVFDRDRLEVNHSLAFGMSSSSNSDKLMSQSLYTTMLKYQFSRPVTVKLNFGLPIHNTYDPLSSLNSENIKSADYFKNMPFDASITWQPNERMLFHISVMRNTSNGPSLFRDNYYHRSVYDDHFMRTLPALRSSDDSEDNNKEEEND